MFSVDNFTADLRTTLRIFAIGEQTVGYYKGEGLREWVT